MSGSESRTLSCPFSPRSSGLLRRFVWRRGRERREWFCEGKHKGRRSGCRRSAAPCSQFHLQPDRGLKEETAARSWGWGEGTLLPAGALISAGIRLGGFDGEEFGAAAPRNLRLLKAGFPSAPPVLRRVQRRVSLSTIHRVGWGSRSGVCSPLQPRLLWWGCDSTSSSLQLPELRVPPARRSHREQGETLPV